MQSCCCFDSYKLNLDLPHIMQIVKKIGKKSEPGKLYIVFRLSLGIFLLAHKKRHKEEVDRKKEKCFGKLLLKKLLNSC
jgi:hypothetical protein